MGNLLATPPASTYRRTLSGSNRIKTIHKIDDETIDLFYVLYIYFILILCSVAVIFLYSIKTEGIPRFAGDRQRDMRGEEGLWTRFIKWLQQTPASQRCTIRSSYPTISIPPENQPTQPSTMDNNICQPLADSTNSGDCIKDQ